MTVAKLIAFLQTQPQNLPVVYRRWSEQVLLEADDIQIEALCAAREDGWVENARPDKRLRKYLVLPGN